MQDENRNNKILQQITKHLGPKKLSLAGRLLVINQVILASIWYLVSCANFGDRIFAQIRALIRNYLWGGITSGVARAKVKWDTITQPINHGGLKIFDPATQTKASSPN